MIDCKNCGMDYDQKEYGFCPYCGHVPEDEPESTAEISYEPKYKADEHKKDKYEEVEGEEPAGIGSRLKYALIGAVAVVVIGAAVSAIFALGDSGYTVPDRYDTIQEAIEAAEDGDEIIIDLGTYRENIDFNGKNITISSIDPDDPDIVDQTIIDGGDSGSVVSFRSGETEEAVLKGVTVTRGNGILISGGSNPVIKKCVVEDNNAEFGAGIAIFDSAPTIVDNSIIGNSGFLGGGLFIEESSPHVEGNRIVRNRAEMGSGMVIISNSSPTVIDNRIADNIAERLGGGIVVAVDSSPTIQDNTVVGNSAGRNGGGMLIEESEPLVESNTISRNRAANGGGIFIVNSLTTALRVTGNSISENLASIAGGGMYMEGSSPDVEDNVFSENISEHLGGGTAVYNSSPIFKLNSFEGNDAQGPEGGGAIWVSADSDLELSDPDNNNYQQNNPDDLVYE
ncbi:MAG: right-handed parallel beta-helix repeat-containing protein [Bacillota bacterium]